MPRYYFHIVQGHSKNLVKDSAGAVFFGVREARKEAVGLARDIVRHGLHGSPQTCKVVVADETGDHVLTVALSDVRACRMQAWISLACRIAVCEPRYVVAWLLAAAVLATIIQAAALIQRDRQRSANHSYQIASAAPEGTIVDVRFIPQASVTDMSEFLDAYKASLVGGPRRGGLYRLRIPNAALSQEEVAKIVSRMRQEKIVAFAAVQ
jgi:hypothetical protein